MKLNKIGILLFNEVELLDFAGPAQVLSSFHALEQKPENEMLMIGLTDTISVSKIGMTLRPDITVEKVTSPLDMLIIPGGMGTRELIKNESALLKIDRLIQLSTKTASVCTGSLVLAKLGKLSGLRATTHFSAIDILQKLDTTIIPDRTKRFFDHDHLIIAEGVSAGIDMSFYLLEKSAGKKMAEKVREYIEYYPSKA